MLLFHPNVLQSKHSRNIIHKVSNIAKCLDSININVSMYRGLLLEACPPLMPRGTFFLTLEIRQRTSGRRFDSPPRPPPQTTKGCRLWNPLVVILLKVAGQWKDYR